MSENTLEAIRADYAPARRAYPRAAAGGTGMSQPGTQRSQP